MKGWKIKNLPSWQNEKVCFDLKDKITKIDIWLCSEPVISQSKLENNFVFYWSGQLLLWPTRTVDRLPIKMITRMGSGWCLNGSKCPQISPFLTYYMLTSGFSKVATRGKQLTQQGFVHICTFHTISSILKYLQN